MDSDFGSSSFKLQPMQSETRRLNYAQNLVRSKCLTVGFIKRITLGRPRYLPRERQHCQRGKSDLMLVLAERSGSVSWRECDHSVSKPPQTTQHEAVAQASGSGLP
ncbi:unnamed protein product [Ixodes persulcatus]